MSHITKLKTVIAANDLGILKRACGKLGLTFLEDTSRFRSYASNMKCSHAIDVPGAKYQIGVCEENDGSYSLQLDDYAPGGLVGKLGNKGQKLLDRFSAEKVRSIATRKGYSIIESYDETNDEIIMRLRCS